MPVSSSISGYRAPSTSTLVSVPASSRIRLSDRTTVQPDSPCTVHASHP